MVAKITAGKSIRGALHYNENKVIEGEAILIMASGFAGEIEQLNFNQKLNRFQHLLELNPNVKTNTIHISLNFHSSEKLDDTALQQIANSYMEKIGYGDQPFLVYRHDDAAHMHVHIVTTNITAQGKRIDLHNNALKSEEARKVIEEDYNLIKAESKAIKQESGIIKADPQKVKYGKIPTKRAISNIITAVSRDYKFTSLAEYNAVLKCFNVTALRGAEHTPMYQNKGLMFSLLDARGVPVGVPVKASSFYSKPTLRNLEKKFEINSDKRKKHKVNLKQRIDLVFGKYSSITKSKFEEEANKLRIDLQFRENEQGVIFGITFIDHQNKVVFNGSDLGKDYSAKSITERFNKISKQINADKKPILRPALRRERQTDSISNTYLRLPNPNLLEKLLDTPQPEYNTGIPRKKKKRRKRYQQINQELTL
ncbi:relaxase/mobilization nuclease domain-containing protein [Pedobacter gandavensis]|uniref:relaxase/mobilization nuclease domain-containing protein n=1 Tax=Pedobacter gandavensis TaxID=2679963 RepID=UPI00293022C2|nr:relaxase/mobilization nuclease domain-containing protein [Pedobacter gandavensis]